MVIEHLDVGSTLLGEPATVVVARPPEPSADVPWVWLLHGWGNTVADVTWMSEGLDAAMAAGDLAPHVIASPAGPWSATAWWVDSAHQDGRLVESAVLTELLPDVERRLGGPAGRERRIVAGASMGGAGAVGWLLRHPELFGAAALVAPAAFADVPVPEPLVETSVAFGVGRTAYDGDRWAELSSYRRLLAARGPEALPVTVATVVGDAEEIDDYPNDTGRSSLTLEAAKLHVALADAPGVTSALRVVAGGHTWDFWIPAFTHALGLVGSASR